MTPPFWNVLGLEPTTDETAIRRAYATRLRTTNPEDDGDGFKALREAYEHALGHARYMRFVAEQEAQEAAESPEAEPAVPTTDDTQADPAPIHVVVEAGYAFIEEDVVPDPIPEAPHVLTAPPEVATLNEHELERRDHDERCRRLAHAVQAGAPFDARMEALQAVLKSPALAQVDVYTATEHWLGHVMITGRPVTDDMVDRVIGFFRWDEQLDLGANDVATRVIYMRERMHAETSGKRILDRIKDPRHEYHRAYKEVLKPPGERSWLSKLLSLAITGRVVEFLDYVGNRAPILLESMNWEAVQWWRDRAPLANRVRKVASVAFFVLLVGGALFLSPTLNRLWNGSSPPASARAAPDGSRPSLADMLEQVRPPMTTAQARRDCTDSVRQLRQMSAAAHSRVLAKAEESCAEVLNRLPASLLMHQYAGIVALRARQPEAALEHFDHILKFSPDDAYALYGRGLVSLIGAEGAEIGDPANLSDALAREPRVKAYFDAFRLVAPDVEPSAKKPRSRLPKREGVPYDTGPEQLENPDAPSGPEIGAFFALTQNLEGEVLLNCLISADGTLRECLVAEESTHNIGLGEVALYMADWVRYTPAELDGKAVDGVPLRYTIRFGPPAAPDAPG